MHLAVSNHVERVHGLNSFREGRDERLPLFGLNAFDDQCCLRRGSLAKKTSQTVAHHAMGIDEERGFRHAFTRCAALQEH